MPALTNLFKNTYSGFPKNIWLLSFVMLINRSGTMVIAFLTLYCTQYLHWTPKYAGIVIAVYGFGSIAGAYLGGRLSDRIGYKIVQESSLIASGLLFIATSFVKDFYAFNALIFILACVNESFRPANASAMAANSDTTNRTRSFALLRLAMNLGWSIGSSLGGFLSHHNYQSLFWVDGGTSIFAGLLMLSLKFKPLQKEEKNEKEDLNEIGPFQNKAFIYFILGTLLYTFCFFQLFTNLPMFYKIGLKIDESVIGMVMAMNGLFIVLLEMVLVNILEKKYSKKIIIVTGTILMAIFYFINCGMGHLPALLIAFGGMSLITIAEMLALPFMNSYYLGYAGKNNTGKYASVYMMSWSIGQILAGYVGGNVINNWGFLPLWIICFILSSLCAWIYSRVIK